MLQAGNRFCPFCFEDQLATLETDDARPPAMTGRGAAAENEARAPVVIDFADTVQADAEEVIHIPGPTGAANEESDLEIGLVRPGAFWQTEASGGGAKARWAARFATPQRKVIAIACALVLIGLAALGLERAYFDDQNEAGRLRAFSAGVERVQDALNRGDLGAAEQGLEILDADHAEDPGVRALKEALDRRVQEQAATREQLPDPALKVSRALRRNEAAASAAPAPLAPEAPVPAISAPAIGTAGSQEKECSEALAALALCAKK